jgi:histidinol phosphatase-like PHP family hydrolase
MAFVDHDLHIHSSLSSCAGPLGVTQTKENIFKYAEENHFNTICVTDHYWDETVPSRAGMWKKENTAWIRSILPLPQSDSVRFLFGCEADMDFDNVIGVAPEHYDNFDFVIIPTNHLHLYGSTCRGDEGMEERAALWCSRLDHVLEQNIPFHKVGIAHLTDTGIMDGKGYLDVLQYISDEEYIRLFRKAADRGVGIELNFNWLATPEDEMEIHLRPYRIAKEEGCRFYLGSDSHALFRFEGMKENFQKITDLLQLDDSHKFTVG